jgi:hypothetical protein
VLFISLFDKDEATEKQPSEPNKPNPLNNGNRDEASDFMLAIPTPSPNDSMIENAESSSSTSRYAMFFLSDILSITLFVKLYMLEMLELNLKKMKKINVQNNIYHLKKC